MGWIKEVWRRIWKDRDPLSIGLAIVGIVVTVVVGIFAKHLQVDGDAIKGWVAIVFGWATAVFGWAAAVFGWVTAYWVYLLHATGLLIIPLIYFRLYRTMKRYETSNRGLNQNVTDLKGKLTKAERGLAEWKEKAEECQHKLRRLSPKPGMWAPPERPEMTWKNCEINSLERLGKREIPYSISFDIEHQYGVDLNHGNLWRAGIMFFGRSRFEPALLFYADWREIDSGEHGIGVVAYLGCPATTPEGGLDEGKKKIDELFCTSEKLFTSGAIRLQVILREYTLILRAGARAWSFGVQSAKLGDPYLLLWCDNGISRLGFQNIVLRRPEDEWHANYVDDLSCITEELETLREKSGRGKVSKRKGGDEITMTLPGGAEIEMVWIEPGTFRMGSPDSDDMAKDDEKPQHKVKISKGFYLGKYVITQGQWRSVMGKGPWGDNAYASDDPNTPVTDVSWEDVQEFVEELNQVERSTMYRLPTEAEWEYACRAETDSTWRWSFGNHESQLGQYAWYLDNTRKAGQDYAHAVGRKSANPWGLHDMHGNVSEWVRDWYGAYSAGEQVDPVGSPSGEERVSRGGNYPDEAKRVRSADRHSASPDFRSLSFGARLLRQGP